MSCVSCTSTRIVVVGGAVETETERFPFHGTHSPSYFHLRWETLPSSWRVLIAQPIVLLVYLEVETCLMHLALLSAFRRPSSLSNETKRDDETEGDVKHKTEVS